MRKADLKDCYDTYTGLVVCLNNHFAHGRFHAGLQVCLEALEFVVPSLKYTKQYGDEREISQLAPLTVVCSSGPPLFEHDIIVRARQFVESTKQPSKHPAGYLRDLDAAIEAEEAARVAWNAIEELPGIEIKALCRRASAREEILIPVLDTWTNLRVVKLVSDHDSKCYWLTTALGADVEAICPECGAHGRGRKELLLAPFDCKRCKHHGYYHIIYPVH